MNAMLQQAQKMQRDMEKKQQEIEKNTYEGHSELVDAVVYGNKKIKSITIKADSLDKEDIEILEDMIKIAVNQAISNVNKDFEDKMGVYAKQFGGLM